MDRILRGIMKYRETVRPTMVQQFVQVKNNPEPKAVFFTCMDSRMLPTRFTQTNVGDMFIVRNAGNLVPHSKFFQQETTTTEPAALELGCVVNNIRHVIVCGHSDCKAMNLLYQLKDEEFASQQNQILSPLRGWLCSHGTESLKKFNILEETSFDAPLVFEGETPMRKFVAYIDPDHRFSIEDKLSQVNCLQQLQNIASYGFLREILKNGEAHLHALWFDIYSGDIYYFSRRKKRFVDVNETSFAPLLEEILRHYT